MAVSTPASGDSNLPVPTFARPQLDVVGRAEAFHVRRIYCVGRNYLEHIREMGEADERSLPFFFQKPSDAVVPDGKVPYPPMTDDYQFEMELVVAIGRGGFNLDIDEALDVVFGYAVGLDMTRRDRQRESFRNGLPWEIGKSFDFSAPCGPIHPVEKVGHVLSGPLLLTLNGKPQQQSTLEKMIWSVPEILVQLSKIYRLMPGDLIFTGTPEGVSAVVPKDLIVATIAGLAPLAVQIVPPEQ